jgi:hypothetical protein
MSYSEHRLTDFYPSETEEASRGVLLYQDIPQLISERLAYLEVETPAGKRNQRFPAHASAPLKPTDPFYVFTKWTLECGSNSVSVVGNSLIEAVESTFSTTCETRIDVLKMKVSIQTPCGLCIRIKLFSDIDGTTMAMFRKDSGDWFAFSSFVNSCCKYLTKKGIGYTKSF